MEWINAWRQHVSVCLLTDPGKAACHCFEMLDPSWEVFFSLVVDAAMHVATVLSFLLLPLTALPFDTPKSHPIPCPSANASFAK